MNEMEAYDFGLRIKELRKRKKYSQEELGHRLGLTKDTISKYENNTLTPSLGKIIRLAQIMNVSMDYLLGFDSIPTIKLDGLTDEQSEWLINTIELLKAANKKTQ